MITTASDIVMRHEESARAQSFIGCALSKHYAAGQGRDVLFAEIDARVGAPYSAKVKAAVTTMDSLNALFQLKPLEAAFVGAVDRQSILDALDGAVRVPVGVQGRIQTANVVAHPVAETAPKSFGRMNFTAPAGPPPKIVAMLAFSDEIARSLDPVAAAGIKQALVSACAAAIDDTLILLWTTTGILVSATAATMETVAQLLMAISSGAPRKPVLAGSYTTLLPLAGMMSDLRALGVGIAVTPAADSHLLALDVSGLLISDGGAVVEATQQASVLLDDGEDPPNTVVTNLWQNNLLALRGERFVQVLARPDAIAYAEIEPA